MRASLPQRGIRHGGVMDNWLAIRLHTPNNWPCPYPPIAGGQDIHFHTAENDAESTADAIADKVEDAIEDAADAAEHSPQGAAEIPHDLHTELAEMHVLHEQHAAAIAQHEGAIGELRARQEILEANYNGLAASTEHAVEAVADVPEDIAGDALELPQEIIEPRPVHFVRRLPKWL